MGIDTFNRTNTYVYDYTGRLVQTIYPDQTSESSGYDAVGNRITSTDRLQRVTQYFYDALNRVTNTIYPDLSSNQTVYDLVGRMLQSTNARGTVTGYAYDVAGRRLVVTNAVGTSLAMTNGYGYDNNGNQTTMTDGAGRITTNVFDALNRQVATLFPDNTRVGTLYDGGGRSIAQTNQDGIVTAYGYDGMGRLVAVTNALNTTNQIVTRYDYDEAGNELHQVDALGRTTTFVYNNLGRRIELIMPGGQSNSMAYDLAGNVILETNANGFVLTNQYDQLNRLISKSGAGGYLISNVYSATGQRTNLFDLSGLTQYGYDSRDRLTNKTVQWTNGGTVTLSYTYDADGDVSTLHSSTSNGVNLAYGYDALGRLTNVLAYGIRIRTNTYDGLGNLQMERFANGVTNLYQYDRLNRLTNEVWKHNSTALGSFTYQLGLTGNRTNLAETVNGASHTYQWTYDSLYRLNNEGISGVATNGYTLDAVGNRLTRSGTNAQSFTNTVNDWLTNDAYDANGNTRWTTNGTLSVGPYEYDAENHLTNANSAITISYDGDGNRVSKTIGGVTTYYLVDDRNPTGYRQVLEEYSGTNLNRVYNYGTALINEVDASGTHYYGMDGHGSVRFLTDTNGTLTDTYVYDAYGNLLASTGTTINYYLYAGQQYDPDLGFYYNRARYYRQNTGRFWTRDIYEGDEENPLSLHKYNYGYADPVNWVDQSGNDPVSSLIYGKQVHDFIGNNFVKSGPGRIYNQSIGVTLGLPFALLKRPDLIDTINHQVYEIKPVLSAPVGIIQLLKYVLLFRHFDPNHNWSFGTAGNYPDMPTVVPLGTFAEALVSPPSYGLIVYRVIDLKVILAEAATVAVVVNADLIDSVAIGTLNDAAAF